MAVVKQAIKLCTLVGERSNKSLEQFNVALLQFARERIRSSKFAHWTTSARPKWGHVTFENSIFRTRVVDGSCQLAWYLVASSKWDTFQFRVEKDVRRRNGFFEALWSGRSIFLSFNWFWNGRKCISMGNLDLFTLIVVFLLLYNF